MAVSSVDAEFDASMENRLCVAIGLHNDELIGSALDEEKGLAPQSLDDGEFAAECST